ncbi:MAG TPA: tRNA pseudouridine(55) synthase TruB [Burkholderiaceae bacterium]|nr:tRNA pseudouridine(55) synthase TruB [Burkholderiaceae bacterium]
MSKTARERIDGVLSLDKPVGPTSNDALIRVRRLFNARKAGHGGTLDPMASGLLPIAFGEATKFLHDLLEADKSYEAVLALGTTTTTGDAEGDVVARAPVAADDAAIAAAVDGLTGEIEQVPPMYSALKRAGRPLYDYARAGQTVERSARRVRIDEMTLTRIDRTSSDAPRVAFHVRCSKGTYVRVLAEAIGERLGCGAHLVALRRTAVGPLRLDAAVSLPSLESATREQRLAMLAPVDALLSGLPAMTLDAAAAARLQQGQRLPAAAFAAGGGAGAAGADESVRVRVYADARLLGVAERRGDGTLAPLRLISNE